MIEFVTVKVAFEITKEAEDSFTVTCPQIGCIFVHEETEESAIRAAQYVVETYTEVSLKHGDLISPEIVHRQETMNFFGRKHQSTSPAVLDVTRDVAVTV